MVAVARSRSHATGIRSFQIDSYCGRDMWAAAEVYAAMHGNHPARVVSMIQRDRVFLLNRGDRIDVQSDEEHISCGTVAAGAHAGQQCCAPSRLLE